MDDDSVFFLFSLVLPILTESHILIEEKISYNHRAIKLILFNF